MKIKNLDELKQSINYSTLLAFIIIFAAVISSLYFTHKEFLKRKDIFNKQEIISATNIYKSNFSEKLSIIASSTVFLDYLRSGEITRKRLDAQFLSQMSTLKSKSISGMQIMDSADKIIFKHGNQTPFFISLKLCYLNQTLDSSMGDCRFYWILYFRKAALLSELLSLNTTIKLCTDCQSYNLINSNEFGSFPIKNSSDLKFKLNIDDENDYIFYAYLFLITAGLCLFGAWSWYRSNRILNDYVANPIKNLTNCLKTDNSLDPANNITEIQYLVNEINSWKSKLNKMQSDENFATIGKIAAQLAHDVRSPLSAIDMLVKNLPDVPENYRITLRNATQRISDISNNFLSQYKNPAPILNESSTSNEHIPSILESMISEKRSQYIDRDIEIKLFILNDAWNTFSFINPVDFKRLISNLINNSIEAVCESGHVIIKLIQFKKYFRIEIIDNGYGISPSVLPKITGGISFGKKNGNGLGLSHAINKIEEWHGYLDIKSNIGIGTEIGINLPLSDKTPSWFKTFLALQNNPAICILDDEPQTHELWTTRFSQIYHSYSSIMNFFTPIDFNKFYENNKNLDVIYLIDYELNCGDINGLKIIEKFNLSNKATLVTNRYDDVEIQKKCVSLGVKIIPKNLILHFPIHC